MNMLYMMQGAFSVALLMGVFAAWIVCIVSVISSPIVMGSAKILWFACVILFPLPAVPVWFLFLVFHKWNQDTRKVL